MELHLTNLNVLVTGASKGIGFAIAEGFVKEGANVTIVSRSQDNLDSAVDSIYANYNIKVKTIAIDLSKKESIASLLKKVGDIDILYRPAN